MRILHVSDTHGHFPKLHGNFDLIVHTGDWLPDYAVSMEQRAFAQEYWIKDNIEKIKVWVGSHPFLLTQGNHDFADADKVQKILRGAGIEAYNLHDKITTIQNTNFYGFPYVPPINGNFNYEKDAPQMSFLTDGLAHRINKTYIDVVAAHCPMYGILSSCRYQHADFGNSHMTNMFNYKIDKDMMPAAYLCGHLHSAASLKIHNGMLVSNMATTQTVIEL